MKINKLFCIDVNLVEKLNRIDNQSKLISDLLTDYFKISSGNSTILQQKEAFLKQNKVKMKEIKREIKLINKLKDLKFDQFCINYCYGKEFIATEIEIKEYIFNRRLKIDLEKFKICQDIVKQNGHIFKKTAWS